MLSLEKRFGMDGPLGSSAGAFNVVQLAGHLLSAGQPEEADFRLAEGLAKRHLGAADWDDVAPLMSALQDRGVDLTGGAGDARVTA